MEIDDITHEALRRYFNVLSKFGYKKYPDVMKLVALIYIADFIKEFSFMITVQDSRDLQRMLYCLYGATCLIPYKDNQTSAAVGCVH